MVNDIKDIGTYNKLLQNYFKKILVGIDGSEKSLEEADYAINLARKYKSELLLIVNIFKIGSWYHGEYPYNWGKTEVLEKVYEKEKQEM